MTVLLGAIADDFTGATDLANTLVQQGMTVTQLIGLPDQGLEIEATDAIVIALKSRMASHQDAVKWSLGALDWLQARGAQQIFFKYCSTFDSTDQGNIGPVADALSRIVAKGVSVICPAFPDNGRTIYKGHLFVNGQLLSESPMRDHPLTPMRDSNLMKVMEAQSVFSVRNIDLQTVRQGVDAVEAAMADLTAQDVIYCVVDAVTNEDLEVLGTALRDHAFITGGSGVARGLPENYRKAGHLGPPVRPVSPDIQGREVVLAGSCSEATRRQIDHASKLWPTFKIDVDALAAGSISADTVVEWVLAQPETTPVLIYASADPREVSMMQQRYGVEEAGLMVENLIGQTAAKLAAFGVRKFIVAGGETSGAVVEALGIKGLRIGPEIDPGVPWTTSLGAEPVALALKSGNFGAEDFFVKALDMLT